MDKEVQLVLDKLQTANRVMENLIDLSMADDRMSEDEKKMLLSINANLENYAKAIIESVGDGKISEKENLKINQIEQMIIKDAQSIAQEDEKISDEEKRLLDMLVDAIKGIGKSGNFS